MLGVGREVRKRDSPPTCPPCPFFFVFPSILHYNLFTFVSITFSYVWQY